MRRQRRSAAFTLLELLAVVVIIGLVSSLVLPGLGVTVSQAVDDQAKRLANDLEFARQRTVMTAVPHRLVLDLDAGAWRVEWRAPAPAEPDEAGGDEEAQIGRQGLDLAPPRERQVEFTPLASSFGRGARLPAGIGFAGVTTPEGVVEAGEVSIAFERDGTADPAEIAIEDAGGFGVVLEVRPLADAVRIRDAA